MPASTVYTCRLTNWRNFCYNAFSVIFLAVFGWFANGLHWQFYIITILFAIDVIMAVTATSQRVTASPSGLTVRFGVFGLPRFVIPRATIAEAELVDWPSSKYRAWGLYWTRKRGWVLAVQTGPALRLRLTDDRIFTVAMSEPAVAARAMGVDF